MIPHPRAYPPHAEQLFQVYELKKYTYIYSTDKYIYSVASDFCYARGYVPVPYLSIEHLGKKSRTNEFSNCILTDVQALSYWWWAGVDG